MAIFDFLKRWSESERTDAPKKPPAPPETPGEQRPEIRCSFCGKTQDQVRKIIAGPTVYICDECIDLCNDIIFDEVDREHQQEQEKEAQCTCCAKEYKRADLSRFPDDTLFCKSCLDGLWNFVRQSPSKKHPSRQEAEQSACTICRQLYAAAELYEPSEEPLYCEFCLAELKSLAEERIKNQR
jgi:hypothetical protein